MGKRTTSAVLCLFVLLGATRPLYAQSRVNVIFRPGTSTAAQDRALLRVGAARIQRLAAFDIVTALAPTRASWKALALDGSVVLVEDDVILLAVSDDLAGAQGESGGDPTVEEALPTGVDRIDAEPGVAPQTGAGVTVAVVDTGIDVDHPNLIVSGGRHFYSIDTGPPWQRAREDGDYDDDSGHGTHVAGSVAAFYEGGTGVVGAAPDATLLAVKVLDQDGVGYTSDVARGIKWAADSGAQVVNLSLGGPGTQTLLEAVQYAAAGGVIMTCAAGNDYGGAVIYPAAYPECIAVSAWTDLDGTSAATVEVSPYGDPDESLASFSNTGPEIEVTAPGVEILSSWPVDCEVVGSGGTVIVPLGSLYAELSGTSMASPHAAGALAILIAGGSSDARTDLSATVEPLPGWTDDEVGAGLVRASAPPPPAPPNDAPVVAITSPTDGSTFDSGTAISFAGTAVDTEDGDLRASLVWSSDINGQIGAGGSFSATLSDGNHVITATATDSGGKTASASVGITVGDPPAEATSVSVDAVTYATEGGKAGSKHLLVTVALVDDLGGPVAGAGVSVSLFRNGALDSRGTGTTGSGGTVTFARKNARPGTYTTTVTGVSAGSLAWDGATPANSFEK